MSLPLDIRIIWRFWMHFYGQSASFSWERDSLLSNFAGAVPWKIVGINGYRFVRTRSVWSGKPVFKWTSFSFRSCKKVCKNRAVEPAESSFPWQRQGFPWSLSIYMRACLREKKRKLHHDFPFTGKSGIVANCTWRWEYPLRMTGHGFQHFLTNEEPDHVLFRCLKESGIFVFDTRFPLLEDLSGQPTFRRSVNDAQGRTVQIYTKEQYDPIQQIEHCKVIRRFFDAWRLVEERESSIVLRYTYPQEAKTDFNRFACVMDGKTVLSPDLWNQW